MQYCLHFKIDRESIVMGERELVVFYFMYEG